MYHSFIFDLDGTIIDSELIGLQALQATLKEKGIEKSLAELRFSIGIPGMRTLEVLNIADISTTLETWLEKQKPLMKNVPLFEGIIDVIAQLPNVGLVTSQTAKEMNCGFYLLNIHHHFQTIVCASDTDKHKPNPEPLELALQLLDCEAKDAIYIGDSIYDLECAKSAGVDFGLALWGSKTVSGFEKADYIFETAYDILKLTNKKRKE
ncbi:HAD family hydrolase [Bacillus chungangensis]|uniref:HAD superfamily hydrolase (TIGR01549 family) n=1 Tax=Bacillus chungangensis TaxID=587633 RepID=A0ABT9WZF1_9BACI|nr:HAD family hydrolase [Bacillus chungangensis]MDQ0178247.1 HAD superfamily hydrolase (TIGR01549 family) [Bacillus chungangensis]